jgi:hypothetical protein
MARWRSMSEWPDLVRFCAGFVLLFGPLTIAALVIDHYKKWRN